MDNILDNMIEKIKAAIDSRKNEIINFGDRIFDNPETGFKEFKTSAFAAEKFRGLGLEIQQFDDIPGVKATFDTGRKGPGIAIMGELDAIICTEHPCCNKETGAVHACGHNAQMAAVVGAAMGILDSGISDNLSGKLHFMAVPAEEYIEVGYRMELREKGVIRYLGGKPELLSRGWFDDVDLCIMVHSLPGLDKFAVSCSENGCLVKKIRFIGKASHAGAAPHEGINALYAANLGLSAINAIRETFKEDEYIRVHPIITKGGDIVNVIPSEVCLETFVRGKTMDAVLKANKTVDRALAGGALAMGAKVEIEDIPGYFPNIPDGNLSLLGEAVMSRLAKACEIARFGHGTASTDVGDLSTLMPVIQPYVGGVSGGLHSADFKYTDKEIAYLLGAKFLAGTAATLLSGDVAEAERIIASFTPIFKSHNEYFDYVNGLFSKKTLPVYDKEDI